MRPVPREWLVVCVGFNGTDEVKGVALVGDCCLNDTGGYWVKEVLGDDPTERGGFSALNIVVLKEFTDCVRGVNRSDHTVVELFRVRPGDRYVRKGFLESG